MAKNPKEFQLPKGAIWVSRDIVQSLGFRNVSSGGRAVRRKGNTQPVVLLRAPIAPVLVATLDYSWAIPLPQDPRHIHPLCALRECAA